MGERATVGAVLVNYNAGAYLTEAIQCILDQVDSVVVVDNASTDDSLGLLRSQLSEASGVVIVENDRNLGFSTACNIGLNTLQDPAVLFLNPDCLMDPGAIRTLYDVLVSDGRIGMVGGLLLNPDGTEQAGGRRAVPTPWRSFVRAFGLARLANRWPRLFFDFHLHKHPLPSMPLEVEAISGACMMVKREAIDDVGLWDEAYFLHCEDLDWCMRFRQRGWKVVFVPDAKMVHIHGVSSKNRKIFVEWHKHKGMMRFYRKFFRHQYPGVLMWLVGLGVWLRFGLIVAAHTVRRLMRGLGLVSD